MRNVQVYIAQSLDGYIAREDGAVDWLEELPNPNAIDHGYTQFYAGVDVVVMGRKTYETILGFGVEWPYPDCRCFVFSRQKGYAAPTERTQIISRLDEDSWSEVRHAGAASTWVVGGGQLIASLLNRGWIDELILSVIPVVLGGGIPLFPGPLQEAGFELAGVEAFETGVVNLTYRRKG